MLIFLPVMYLLIEAVSIIPESVDDDYAKCR